MMENRKKIKSAGGGRLYFFVLSSIKFPIHPFIFTLVGAIYTYFSSSRIATPNQVIRPLLILWIIVAMLLWFATIILRDRNMAGVTVLIIILSFFYAPIFFYAVFAVLLIATIVWLIYLYLRKRKLKFFHASVLYNLIGTGLIVYEFFTFAPLIATIPTSVYRQAFFSASQLDPIALVNSEYKPDIYYIVVDDYSRVDVLHEYFNYDNSNFIDYLRSVGFIVPTDNHSNYTNTAISLTSALNMNYIERVVPGIDKTPFWWTMKPFLAQNIVAISLKEVGYQTVSMSTDWGITDIKSSDIFLHPYPLMVTDYEYYLLMSTPLRVLQPLLRSFVSIPSNETHRNYIKFSFDSLSALPALATPKFVFMHVIIPHPPFVFSADGTPLDIDYPFSFRDASDFPGLSTQYQMGYIGQVEYVNAQLKRAIDSLISYSEVQPIILLQGDHGSGMMTDFSSLENTCLHERFSPLAAYYMPGLKSSDIPNDITPVNLFRIILNKYFGANLELLDNMEFFPPDPDYIFRNEDVSSRIDSICE